MDDRWTRAITAVAVVVLLGALLVDGPRRVNVNTGDTNVLVAGARVAHECIADGVWQRCGQPSPLISSVGAFAVAQYVPAVAMVALGWDDPTVIRGLAWLSTLAFLGALTLCATAARRLLGARWALVLAVAFLSGPGLLYGLLPYGEGLAMALCFAAGLAAVSRRWWLVAVATFLAAVTRETAVVLVVPAVVLAARSARDRLLPPWPVVAAALAAGAAAVVTHAAFNVFRYGTRTNLAYSVPGTRVPGWSLRLRLALANWLGPNVGVGWFWPVLTLVLAGLAVALVLQARRRRAWWPGAAVLGLVGLMTAGLASWYSTFGWLAWGPRLSLPLLPLFAVAAIRAGGTELARLLDAVLARRAWLLPATALVVVLALPQAGIVWNERVIALPAQTDSACPELKALADTTPEYFYGCGLHAAWRPRPSSLWQAAATPGGPAMRIAQAAQAVALLGLVVLARRRTPRASGSDGR